MVICVHSHIVLNKWKNYCRLLTKYSYGAKDFRNSETHVSEYYPFDVKLANEKDSQALIKC
jgi:hypothetical protein